jgi:hypothetical protein
MHDGGKQSELAIPLHQRWGHLDVIGDQTMTLAAIDRLVHHATIFEMNVESYRRRTALDRKRNQGRSPTPATSKENAD